MMKIRALLFSKTTKSIVAFVLSVLCVSLAESQNRVVISKPELMIFVLSAEGDTLHQAPIAAGRLFGQKRRADDWKTPEGHFRVKRISTWLPKTPEMAPYGSCFMLIETPGFYGIGMHGTNNPKSIGTRCSHGCIRMFNDDARTVLGLVEIGTPVIILPDTVGVYRSQKSNPILFEDVNVIAVSTGCLDRDVMSLIEHANEIKMSWARMRKMGLSYWFED